MLGYSESARTVGDLEYQSEMTELKCFSNKSKNVSQQFGATLQSMLFPEILIVLIVNIYFIVQS